jgi:hypothetical protein
MRDLTWQRVLAVAAGVVLAAGSGCQLRSPISVPQLEGVSRAVNEPREARTSTYQRCVQQALAEHGDDQNELIRCMKAAGFGFLAESAFHRRSYCLEVLDKPGELPDDFCFQRVD